MIYKKSPDEIEIMRRAGRIVAETLARLHETLHPGITTGELDRVAEETITKAGATPSFKGYRGYPASICASPNDVIVHGIPGAKRLEEGPARVAEHGRLDDQHSGQCGGRDLHAPSRRIWRRYWP